MDTLRLLMVGTGTCALGLGSMGSSMLVRTSRVCFLVDAGTGVIQGLLELCEDPDKIDRILLTHHHPDHAGELAALIQTLCYGLDPPRTRPLYVSGGPGTNRLFECWAELYGGWIFGKDFSVMVEETASGMRSVFEGVEVRPCRVAHTSSSLAYRFELDKRSLVLTGDTGPCEELVELCQGADVLVSECSLPDELEKQGHMTPSHVGELAQRASVKTLVLTHMYPVFDKKAAVIAVQSRFRGNVLVAGPGLSLAV